MGRHSNCDINNRVIISSVDCLISKLSLKKKKKKKKKKSVNEQNEKITKDNALILRNVPLIVCYLISIPSNILHQSISVLNIENSLTWLR